MTISNAINKLAFVASKDYDFYLFVLDTHERIEEKEEVKEAWETLESAGIELTDEILRKKEQRYANVVPEPIRFIDRQHFKAIDIDELPF